MKAFVTGGTGMIGSHLIERLIREGIQVRALVRKTSDTSLLNDLPDVELVYGDITDSIEKLSRYVERADYVVHCAAMVEDWADRDEMYRLNVTALENLILASRKSPIKKFLFMGSMAVLGMGPQPDLDESAPYVYSGDNYNYTKIEAEKLVMRYAKENNFPAVIIRPPYVYGPRDRQFFPRLVTPLEREKFAYIGSGNNPFEIVYVENLVEAMWLALKSEKSSGEVFMITDGQPITRRQLVEAICEGMGLPKPKICVPYFLAKAACPLFEGIAKLAGMRWRPVLNRFRLKFLYPPMTFNISKARSVLGYKPPFSLEESLERTIAWYRKERGKSVGSKQ